MTTGSKSNWSSKKMSKSKSARNLEKKRKSNTTKMRQTQWMLSWKITKTNSTEPNFKKFFNLSPSLEKSKNLLRQSFKLVTQSITNLRKFIQLETLNSMIVTGSLKVTLIDRLLLNT
jgi:hypothetical protein